MKPKRGPPSKDASIVVVGAGVFGLGTALELKKRGYRQVTVLDRYLPPVPDGSSVDISRVIRTEYADSVYNKMALEAHQGWTTKYSSHYYESGFVMLAEGSGNPYVDKAKEISKANGQAVKEYPQATQLRKDFPSIQANLAGLQGYMNPQGGWADAAMSIQQLSHECSKAGVSFITGARGTVLSLRYDAQKVVGVNVADGSSIKATQVILATGAWSNRLLTFEHASTASGQPVGFIQLNNDEFERLKDMPVIINLTTGVFVFPPTPDSKILKVARHGYGFATTVAVDDGPAGGRTVSSPRRDSSNAESGYLPDDADAALRDGLRQLMPEFAERPWINRRLCWYSDTPEGDFIFDYHPNVEGLFVATGGAGQ